ncbi:MAG: lipid IV(A) 3-deoxy-D-manno-octulosonic acid transferase [Chromatocurvus sp.]
MRHVVRHVYSAVFRLLLPLVFLRLLWRSLATPAYRQRWGERLGFAPAGKRCASHSASHPDTHSGTGPVIWLHAVSLGETLAARPLVEFLLAEFSCTPVLVTTTTPTGSRQVRALFGERVLHVYAPLDTPGAVGRFLTRYQPRLLLLIETELWPNLLHYCRRRQCPVLLANARLSERSFRGYARLGRFGREMLASVSHVACQSQDDATRFAALGVPADRLSVCGNIKFDLDVGGSLPEQIRALVAAWHCSGRFVFAAVSTHAGEDEAALSAFAALRRQEPDALLLLVPRHPERFDAVHALCTAAGWATCRRSLGESPGADTAVVVGDTVGELLLLLGAADVAFVGGSLVPHGGHNLLEPAALGVPVLSGESLFNFTAVRDLLLAGGALALVADAAELADVLCELAADDPRRREMGESGLRAVAANRGARARIEAQARRLLARQEKV